MCWGEAYLKRWWCTRAQQTQWSSPPSLSFILISGQHNNHCWTPRLECVLRYLLASCWSKTLALWAWPCWWCSPDMVTSSAAQLPVPRPSFQASFLDSLGASTVLGLFPTGRLHVVPCFRSDGFNGCDFQVTDMARRCCPSLESTLVPLGNAGIGGGGGPGSPQTTVWSAACHRAGAIRPGLPSQNGHRDADKHEEPWLRRAHCLGFPQQSWVQIVGVLGGGKMWPLLTKSPYFPLRLTYVQVYRGGGISHREAPGSPWVHLFSLTAVLW